jgi:hypothetical protein
LSDDVADIYLADIYLADIYLADIYLADIYLADIYLADIYLADIYLADIYLADYLRTSICGEHLVETRVLARVGGRYHGCIQRSTRVASGISRKILAGRRVQDVVVPLWLPLPPRRRPPRRLRFSVRWPLRCSSPEAEAGCGTPASPRPVTLNWSWR